MKKIEKKKREKKEENEKGIPVILEIIEISIFDIGISNWSTQFPDENLISANSDTLKFQEFHLLFSEKDFFYFYKIKKKLFKKLYFSTLCLVNNSNQQSLIIYS